MQLSAGESLSKILDELFSRVLYSKIFKNRELLRPDYIPDELPHRENQIIALAKILAPALQGERPSNVFLYGLTGTGKTAVTRHVLKALEERRRPQTKLSTVYVNCRHEDTNYRVLAKLCEAVDVQVPFTGLSTAEVFKRFIDGIERKGGILIVVLDEIDALVKKSGDDLLYKLTRVHTELKKSKICIIGITNDLKFTDYLSARVLSSLGEEELVFPPYTAPELEDILKMRARDAFKPGAIEEGVIKLCAALAAKEHGDARRALDLLRIAGEIAEREGSDKVRVEHVRRAHREIERDRVVEVLKTLPLHSKIVVLALHILSTAGKKEATTGELYNTYREMCKKLSLDELTQRRVTDLINELDMLGIVNAKVVSKGRYGRTKVIRLSISEKSLKEGLLSDEFLAKAIGQVKPK